MKGQSFYVHHIHVKVGDNVYTLTHPGSYVDVVNLLNQIAFIQDHELTKRSKNE